MARRNWIAVASADHARRGGEGGFVQVSHGKLSPLKRIAPGDRIAIYSPTTALGSKEKCQAFTLIGIVRAGDPYQADMGGGFRPYRRDVRWLESKDAPIAPLLEQLEFAASKRNWGYQLRFGLFAVSDRDIALIARAMRVKTHSLLRSTSRARAAPRSR